MGDKLIDGGQNTGHQFTLMPSVEMQKNLSLHGFSAPSCKKQAPFLAEGRFFIPTAQDLEMIAQISTRA